MIHVRRVLLFAALLLGNLLFIWSPDVVPASLFAWTVVREGNVDYDEFTSFLDREYYYFRACGRSTATEPAHVPRALGGPPPPGPNDHVCSIFPPGAGVLALPVFVPFVLAGQPPDDIGLLVLLGKLVGALEEAVAAALLIAAASRVAPQSWAFVLGLLYLFGTSVRTVSSQALWQHGGVHMLLALALLLLVRHFQGAGSRREVFAAGIALGFAVVVRQTSVFFTVAAFAALLMSRPSRSSSENAGVAVRPGGSEGGAVAPAPGSWLAFAAGAALGVLPLVGYDLLAFGDPLAQGYGEKPFGTPLLLGLYGLLGSPSRGLLVYSPFLLFALPPLVRAWRARDTLAPLLRAFGAASGALLLLYAFYAEWWGGRVFGARFLSDAFPVLVLALAAAPPASKGMRRLFVATAGWSLLLHNAAALVYDQSWDTWPINVNFDQSPLFSWTDPQWLAVLAAALRPGVREVTAIALSALVLGLLLYLERRTLRQGATLATRERSARAGWSPAGSGGGAAGR